MFGGLDQWMVALVSIRSSHMIVYAFVEMKVDTGSRVPRRGRRLMKACFRLQMKGDLVPGRFTPKPSPTLATGILRCVDESIKRQYERSCC